ncbi:hypothetical protein B6U67_00375 [Methanosarcinales archaeon ex4484_138]|nr:MAG: hypothetical protein B6U67_00375 [Methanosarcinales archaeon ex4484_138]RLG26577.1 MAG: hypothetical protein DRN85_02555 [Methanosarcinales archaeon]
MTINGTTMYIDHVGRLEYEKNILLLNIPNVPNRAVSILLDLLILPPLVIGLIIRSTMKSIFDSKGRYYFW